MSEIGKVLTTFVNDESEAQTWHGTHVAVKRGELDKYIAEQAFWPEFTKRKLEAPGVYALYDAANGNWVMNGGRAHIVTKNYPVMQHAEMLTIPEEVHTLVEDGSAGYFGNGEVGWRQWGIKSFEPVKGDTVSMRFMLSNPHDGTMKFLGGLCSERVVCRNTHMIALGEIKAQDESGKVSLKKTKNARDRYEKGVLKHIADIVAQAAGFQVFAEKLAKTPTSDDKFEKLLDIFMPGKLDKKTGEIILSSRTENQRELLRKLRQPGEEGAMGSDIPGVSDTLWGDLNVFTEYLTHWQGTRVTGSEGMDEAQKENVAQEQRVMRSWFGAGRKQMDAVAAELWDMVA